MPDEKYYDPMPKMCEISRCKCKADYGYMDLIDECGADYGLCVCKVHATAIELYGDGWRDDTEWDNLTKQEKRRVSQIVYRWRNGRS